MEKYVNMADVITFDPDELQDQFPNTELIELLFFAYRDFVSYGAGPFARLVLSA